MGRTLPQLFRRRLLQSAVLLLVLAGCSGDATGPEGVSRVVIVNADLTMAVGATDSLVAYAISTSGTNLAVQIDWRSTAPLIATISSTGRLTALAPGSANIIASTSGKADTLRLTVAGSSDPTVQLVVIQNSDLLLAEGATDSLIARPIGAGGSLLNTPITWQATSPLIASVSATGRVTALTPGTTNVIASAGGKADTVQVVVHGPLAAITVTLGSSVIKTSDTTRARATGRDDGGRPVPISPEWAVDDTTAAIITPQGLMLGLRANNNVLVTATQGSVVGFINLSVIPAGVKSVRITPATANLSLNATLAYQLEVLDEFDVPITDRAVAWTTSNPTVATVGIDGVALARDVGSATITATVEGKSGSSIVTVLPIPQNVYYLEVNNQLLAWLRIYVNDAFVGTVPEQSQGSFQLTKTATAQVRYEVVRAKGETSGEPLSETLPMVTAPDGVVSISVDNIINSKTYFTPLLRSLVAPKIDVEMSERDLAGPCGCSITQQDPERRFGYWPFRAGASVILIRTSDPSKTITLPVWGGVVEPGTGIWRYTVLVAP